MKKAYLLATISTSLVLSSILLLANNNDFSPLSIMAENNYNLTLDSSVSSTLSSSFEDGSLHYLTSEGYDISFDYKGGKKADGALITLDNELEYNGYYNKHYIGNASQIVGAESISVDFTGGTHILLYASNDLSHFYRIDALTSTHNTSTYGKGYRYYRFVNGNQDGTEITINSINFSYSCDKTTLSDESIDILNNDNKYVFRNGEALEEDTSLYYEGFNSTHSYKFSQTASSQAHANFIIPLGRDITGDEFSKLKLDFKTNSKNNSAYDSSHDYYHFFVYPCKDKIKHSKYYQTENITNGNDSWTKLSVDFANVKSITSDLTFNAIQIRCYYLTAGYSINIDDFVLYYNNDYFGDTEPNIVTSSLRKTMYSFTDLSSGTMTATTETSNDSTRVIYENIVADNTTAMGANNVSSFGLTNPDYVLINLTNENDYDLPMSIYYRVSSGADGASSGSVVESSLGTSSYSRYSSSSGAYFILGANDTATFRLELTGAPTQVRIIINRGGASSVSGSFLINSWLAHESA